jgi:hypothetical protein
MRGRCILRSHQGDCELRLSPFTEPAPEAPRKPSRAQQNHRFLDSLTREPQRLREATQDHPSGFRDGFGGPPGKTLDPPMSKNNCAIESWSSWSSFTLASSRPVKFC